MHFDDRLATVLAIPLTGPAIARIQYRQLLDLLSQPLDLLGTGPTVDAAMVRLGELSSQIPAAEREAILREPTMRLFNPDLLSRLAAEEPGVASASFAASDLSDAEWLELIPALPIRARGMLRHRRDFSPAVAALLDRLGIADRGLADPSAAQSIPERERMGRPELSVIEGGAAAVATAPAPPAEEAGIGAIVRKIQAFRNARAPAEAAEQQDHPARRAPARHALPLSLDFTTDADGRIDWVDNAMAPALIGTSLLSLQGKTAPHLTSAVRHRQPVRDQDVTLDGAPELKGRWRLDALPRFAGVQGRFTGYAGRLRRDRRDASSARASDPADRMRQVLHELRTPANAIQISAEIIQQQLYGPAPHEYRALAAAIAGDTAQILAGFEELDRLVRLETGVLRLAAGECDLARLVAETVNRLQAWTRQRGTHIRLEAVDEHAMTRLDGEEAERLVWRLLASLVGAAAQGETLNVTIQSAAIDVAMIIDLPPALVQRLDEAESNGHPLEVARSLSSGMFGLGFTLRLAAAEASAAGGLLERRGACFRLILPRLTPAAARHTHL